MTFIIFGLLRRFTVLGMKLDECATCGNLAEHVVGRKTAWGHIFWLPVLFLGFSHGMICSACGTWTGLSFGDVRAGMKTGKLSRNASRATSTLLPASERAASTPPLDTLVVNPKRGFWDFYLKAWPVLVAGLLVLGTLSPKTPASAGSVGATDSYNGAAHTCWMATDGTISGCRLADGFIEGQAVGTPITCYFNEPLPATASSISCRQ
jgi:hypothetical protein